MAISSGMDLASMMNNDTLDDYMCNLAGLIPSRDTSAKQHQNSLQNFEQYWVNGEWKNDIATGLVQGYRHMGEDPTM